MSPIRRLLVPTDFSATSDLAVSYAIEMAARLGADIHLLHVLEEPGYATIYPDGYSVGVPTLRTRMVEDAETQLAALAARCVSARVVATTHVMFGTPSSSIVHQALVRDTGLIVMGTHGRSGVAHLLLGSVAERVVRTAPCPVLTVRDTARVGHALFSWDPERAAADAPAHAFAHIRYR